MRPCCPMKWVPLALIGAAAALLAVRAGAGDALTPPEAASARVSRVDTDPGHGETQDAAREEAEKKACAWVRDYLDAKYGDIGWTPTPNELVSQGVVHTDKPAEWNTDALHGYEVTAHVDLSDAALRRLQPEVDRQRKRVQDHVVYARLGVALRILAGLVALCLVVVGYLRLEDLTRGYYTAVLRLSAGLALLLTVAGLFLLS
jgi:hypothetical protein